MNSKEIREKIDAIDSQMADLFCQRMGLAADIARFKKENNLPILNTGREREVLSRMVDLCGEELEGYIRVLYATMFDVSRSYQHSLTGGESALCAQIDQSLAQAADRFPTKAVVACQGVEGAYSQLACEKLFKTPSIIYFHRFDDVFHAVAKGMCQYGILPIENSSAGSVTAVYDLMKEYNFQIVRGIRLKVSHCLLARPGVKISDIKEIASHEQALNQCSKFLAAHPEIKVTVCENTAAAARMVAESGRDDIAALSSRNCAGLYGLKVLQDRMQNSDSNYTRFICISSKPEIYPGADKISLMVTLPHQPGSLYRLITRFASLELNLTKLESRPIPGSDFEFRFYFDLEGWVGDPSVKALLADLQDEMDEFVFLGNYSEVL
ncbi:MAG: chorismate mutase [Oscillospiraceae bacterium]|nr:chorismate mutase [Oscillospiraceae bacterium]